MIGTKTKVAKTKIYLFILSQFYRLIETFNGFSDDFGLLIAGFSVRNKTKELIKS